MTKHPRNADTPSPVSLTPLEGNTREGNTRKEGLRERTTNERAPVGLFSFAEVGLTDVQV